MRRLRGTSNNRATGDGEPGQMTDLMLVAAAQRDIDAFGPIFDRYWEPVFRFCYYRTGDWHIAEDAASQVFVNALAALNRFHDGGRGDAFQCWLFTIARNVVTNAHSYDYRVRQVSLDDSTEIPSNEPGPEIVAINTERHDQARSLLLRVTDEQRELLELRLAGLNCVEIASVLGRSPGSIRVAQHRAITALRELTRMESDSGIEKSHA